MYPSFPSNTKNNILKRCFVLKNVIIMTIMILKKKKKDANHASQVWDNKGCHRYFEPEHG